MNIEKDEYKTLCDTCRIKTWYTTEQGCHVPRCKGILKLIDFSGLDKRFKSFYEKKQRIEVTYKWGEKERFYIGRSTGWKPIWLTIKKSNSTGGAGLLADCVVDIKPLNKFA